MHFVELRARLRPAAHSSSRRLAPTTAAARHACQRPARHQLPLASAPAADHAATLWQWCCPIGRGGARSAPLVGDSHARSAPAARHGLEIGHKLASEARRAGELAAAHTRPTVRGLPVVCSSPRAEGRRNRRAARRSGSSWRGPSPTEYWAAAGPYHAPIRGARSTVSHLVSLEPELWCWDVGVGVTLVTPPGEPSDLSTTLRWTNKNLSYYSYYGQPPRRSGEQ
jgi:hypothetical protein